MKDKKPRFNSMLRIQQGMTQRELAEAIGVDRSTVTKWETTDLVPRVKLFPAIARALNCKIGDILC